ncbi:SCP2 sterol-binding domain-containing protein [Fictibacillus sp. Mic-4]|uniref:SCP2 sterol-binding domain-containing protein n=1 Tax=Fictibacillus TaxID=1329200 RepID=UPI00040DC481|nr:SCP2 sterol-binding domain-containing protein [Fictibacillus gelatini]
MAKSILDYTLQETKEKMEMVLNANPKPIEGMNAIYQFDIIDESDSFQLHLADGKAVIKQESPIKADCTLQLKMKDFKKLIVGKLNGAVAYMTGKLKVKGDMGKAIKIEKVLHQYDIE